MASAHRDGAGAVRPEQRGGAPTSLERVYRRLGPRYPRVAIRVVVQLALLLVALSVAALALFVEMSVAQLVRLALVGLVGLVIRDVIFLRRVETEFAPIIAWIEGRRDEPTALAAWRAASSFPLTRMREAWLDPVLAGISYIGIAAWVAYAVWELDLAAWTAIPLFAGVLPFLLYVNVVRFFGFERALRPVLEDIGRGSGAGDEAYERGLSLRTRLLVGLPAINVITGVITVGITGQGHNLELADLGLAVPVSTAIAATITGALILLLADSVSAPIGALHDATERVAAGDFSARVPVVTTDETGALACSFNEMAAGLEQRERLRDAFGVFVDPQLTERVLEEGTDFAGEEVELSLLFMDIRGFTSYSEQADAREVVARLNDLYGEVVPVILRHGGHANKFIGDGLLAIFGAPDRPPDHADRAVGAALEIAELVRNRYRGELRVGIGVNTGRVVVGTIGGGGRLDFTVIGDAVNTAARVESATRETDDDVLITEATRAALNDDLATWDKRLPVALKGKTKSVPLYGPARTDRDGWDFQQD